MEKKILIIDDSEQSREEVVSVLNDGNYKTLEACDAADALKVLKTDSPEIGLIICDVIMPEMDGISLLEKIKSDNRYSHLPVVMISVDGIPEMVKKAQDAGAIGWLIKPVSEEKIINMAQKTIG